MPVFGSETLRHYLLMAAIYLAFFGAAVISQLNLVLAPGWLEGLGIGATCGWALTQSRTLRAVAATAGILLLAAVMIGRINAQALNVRAMFQGAALGMPLGLNVVTLTDWRRVHGYFKARAEENGDAVLLTWLAKHRPNRR